MRINSKCKVCGFNFMRQEIGMMLAIENHVRIIHVTCFHRMRGVPPRSMEIIGRIQFEMKEGRLLYNPA